MMKLVAFFAFLAVAASKPAPGFLAAPITYTAVHTPAVAVHSAPVVSTYAAAPLVSTYAAVPASHSYISGVSLHAAPIEHHGYKIIY